MKGLRMRGVLVLLPVLMALPGVIALAQNPDPTAPAKYGFGFRNFVDSMYTWDIYCHSFFGVPIDPSQTWGTATFDRLFYELAFKTKLPDPAGNHTGAGNCFGISLTSLMMNKFGGYYGYCSPTSAYRGDTNQTNTRGPDDHALRRVINIMHGRQLSLAAVETYLDQFLTEPSTDSRKGFSRAQETIAKEGPCLVSITAEANPIDGSGGHTLIGYGATGTVTQGKIWVVDPNRLWAVNTPLDRGWYQGDSNYINCNLTNGDWNFRMAGDTVDWPLGHGNLIILPLSLVGPPGRVPSSLGFAVGELLAKLFFSDGSGETPGEDILRHKHLTPER